MSVSVFDAVLFNLRDPALQWASLWCCVGPFTWNILCRLEFYGGLLSRAFGSKKVGCAALALYILAVGWYRDYVVKIAMDSQPKVLEVRAWCGRPFLCDRTHCRVGGWVVFSSPRTMCFTLARPCWCSAKRWC